MATPNSTKGKALTKAAGYIRMSGRQQDKSPQEQKEEILKLAAKERCEVVGWFCDEAITGDSSTDERPGLAALQAGAKAGEFSVVLAWHSNRVSREDAMDALVFYNTLRKCRIKLITCCEGSVDLDDFASQLLVFVRQKANNDFLLELSAKTLRGRIANAKAGGHNGGPAVYGMDRGLFDLKGNLVRRLGPGEHVRQSGHRVQLLPGTDAQKIAAVRFAFHRFDEADIGVRALARELEAKSYPSPGGKGWAHYHVTRLLKTRAYIGTACWGATAWGKYYIARGDSITPSDTKARKYRQKPQEEAIAVAGAHEGIIPVALFDRVQRKLPRDKKAYRPSRRADFPLAGLLFCAGCEQPMYGAGLYAKNRQNGDGHHYHYHQYVCGTYSKHGNGGPNNLKCGRNSVDADRLLSWLITKLQQIFLGPERDALVAEIKSQIQAEPEADSGDLKRLQRKAASLEKEVARLVKAIRTLDSAELVEELALVQAERDRVVAELAQAGRSADPIDVDAEAERVTDQLRSLGEHLTDADPAVLREVLNQLVSRIICRFEVVKGKGQSRSRLIGGRVELRPQPLLSVFGVLVQAS